MRSFYARRRPWVGLRFFGLELLIRGSLLAFCSLALELEVFVDCESRHRTCFCIRSAVTSVAV